MRELTVEEIKAVSGGLEIVTVWGTPGGGGGGGAGGGGGFGGNGNMGIGGLGGTALGTVMEDLMGWVAGEGEKIVDGADREGDRIIQNVVSGNYSFIRSFNFVQGVNWPGRTVVVRGTNGTIYILVDFGSGGSTGGNGSWDQVWAYKNGQVFEYAPGGFGQPDGYIPRG